MAAVLTEVPRLEEKAIELTEEADDEVEEPQEAIVDSSSKKKKKKKKKKKGWISFKHVLTEKILTYLNLYRNPEKCTGTICTDFRVISLATL